MKNCYVSTFISGLSDVIIQNLSAVISDIEVIQVFDGVIIYKTSNYDKVMKLKFVNNSFLLLGLNKSQLECSFNSEVDDMIKKMNLNIPVIRSHIDRLKNKSFKIISIDKNIPVSINYRIVEKLEATISKELNLKLNKRNPDLDFVFLRRTEGWMMFLLKLTYNRMTEKSLKRGELRPELAYNLVSLANLDNTKMVMDPFCGYGSIPKQVIQNFEYNMCFASDSDDEKVLKLKSEYKKNQKKLFIKQRDALNLTYFEDKFIDTIITDPPWNIYDKQRVDFSKFYVDMLKEFKRILKDDGVLIILMGNIIEFDRALKSENLFTAEKKYNILVNGKKAKIYVLKKRI